MEGGRAAGHEDLKGSFELRAGRSFSTCDAARAVSKLLFLWPVELFSHLTDGNRTYEASCIL